MIKKPKLIDLEKCCPVSKGPILQFRRVIKEPTYSDCYCCPQQITLQNGRSYYHYTYDPEISTVKIYYLPFKVMIYPYATDVFHLNRKAKVGSIEQFKKIITVPSEKIPYGDGDALINKLKIWNLFK